MSFAHLRQGNRLPAGGTTMPEYIVYREGWSDANQKPSQGLPYRMAVRRLFADSAEEACRLAAGRVSLVPGQRFTAELAAEVDAREVELNVSPRASPSEET
jgi:hypothetical protein